MKLFLIIFLMVVLVQINSKIMVAQNNNSRLEIYASPGCVSPLAESCELKILSGNVVTVFSGDKIEVLLDNTNEYKIVKLVGIEAPKGDEKCEKGSREFLESLILNREIELILNCYEKPKRKIIQARISGFWRYFGASQYYG